MITNHDLAQQIDTSDEWIETRSGIKERRWAAEDVTTFDLAHQASMNAISNANIDSEEIDMIIVGTLSSDYFFPGVSAQLQDSLNLNTIGAFDIKAACSAFIYSLSIADQFIKTGMAKKILVVCPASLKLNWKREIEFYSDESVGIVEGKKWQDGKYVIINYDILKNF